MSLISNGWQASILSHLHAESDVHAVHRGVQEGWKLIDDILQKLCQAHPCPHLL